MSTMILKSCHSNKEEHTTEQWIKHTSKRDSASQAQEDV
jgi:hypothetical protein